MGSVKFMSAVASAFSFLEREYGYACVVGGPSHCRYEGNGVFVGIRYDSSCSFELAVRFGPINGGYPDDETDFTLGELLRLECAPEAKDLSFVQASTVKRMEHYTERMAAALKRHGESILSGNRLAFERLNTLRADEAHAYQRENELRCAREDARTAWQARDYAGVVRALESFEGELTSTEDGWLEFSRERR